MKAHTPQDQLYGPLSIPNYCWPIIDTDEFQRLRNVAQLGTVKYVYIGANHNRFEHSLGVAHLAGWLLKHLETTQPELNLTEHHKMAAIIAALCHDLGHGPFSVIFANYAKNYDSTWNNKDMSIKILKLIVSKYNLDIPEDVVDAACNIIIGDETPGYPKFLSTFITNNDCDIDINKFDYLSRDMNRTINTGRFEYDRLITNCCVVNDKLAWKKSEIPTIERFFYNFNNMHIRVYKHRVVQAVDCMIHDILECIFQNLDFDEILNDPAKFCEFDDRILYMAENGEYGPEAKKLADRLITRDLYKMVGELRIRPQNKAGITYSQQSHVVLEENIAESVEACTNDKVRVVSMKFHYGVRPDRHPLLTVPFYTGKDDGEKKLVMLSKDEISAITPQYFSESVMRVYSTGKVDFATVTDAYNKWKANSPYF